ncbi:MAG: PEP-CTERM sorting domain-containing protein [Planctomycetota bacterium]
MSGAVRVFVLAGFLVCALSPVAFAQKIHNESGGVVVMEMENTESPLGKWGFIGPGANSTYPTGALGTGHLEYQGPFTRNSPGSTLKYQFKINQSGKYTLWLRAHKRLLGNASDKNNDAFVKLEGEFTSGSSDVPLRALTRDTKLYGGKDTGWGLASRLDGNGAHHKAPTYYLTAGEIYTFSISGRSNRFNVDRIIFTHEDSGYRWNQRTELLPESSLLPVPEPATAALCMIGLGAVAMRRCRLS